MQVTRELIRNACMTRGQNRKASKPDFLRKFMNMYFARDNKSHAQLMNTADHARHFTYVLEAC